MGPRLTSDAQPTANEGEAPRPVLHVCIATREVMANLLPLLHLPWSDVAVIVSDAMKREGEHLEFLVRGLLDFKAAGGQRGRVVCLPLKHVAPLRSVREDMAEIASRIRQEFPAHEVIVNWTGGLKLMSQAVLDAFRPFAKLFYCHTDEDSLEAVWPTSDHAEPLPAKLTDVDTYLLAHGYRITQQRALTEEQQRVLQRRRRLTATLMLSSQKFGFFKTTGGWEYAVSVLHDMASAASPTEPRGTEPGRLFSPVQVRAGLKPPPEPTQKLLEALREHGILTEWQFNGTTLQITFASVEASAYLQGGYAEEFVLLSMLSLGLPARHFASNVHVDVLRPEQGRKRTELNELDAVLVWRNRILIIECKAGVQLMHQGKSQDILNKLAALQGVVGRFGKAWLVSKRELTPGHNADVLDRMKQHRITGIAGPEQTAQLPALLSEWVGPECRPPTLLWEREIWPWARLEVAGTGQARQKPHAQTLEQGKAKARTQAGAPDQPKRGERRKHDPGTGRQNRHRSNDLDDAW